MPWYAWLYLVVITSASLFIGWCAWQILGIARRMNRNRKRGDDA